MKTESGWWTMPWSPQVGGLQKARGLGTGNLENPDSVSRTEEMKTEDAPSGMGQLEGLMPGQYPLLFRTALGHLFILPSCGCPPKPHLISLLLF